MPLTVFPFSSVYQSDVFVIWVLPTMYRKKLQTGVSHVLVTVGYLPPLYKRMNLNIHHTQRLGVLEERMLFLLTRIYFHTNLIEMYGSI